MSTAPIKTKETLPQLLIRLVMESPGVTDQQLRDTLQGFRYRRHRLGVWQALAWLTADEKAIHWHRVRRTRHYYPGQCAPGCPGARR
jgi:hypothetical protein